MDVPTITIQKTLNKSSVFKFYKYLCGRDVYFDESERYFFFRVRRNTGKVYREFGQPRNCRYCGKEFFSLKYMYNQGYGRTCSRRCSRLSSNSLKGENHWNWQGGITNISEIIRKSSEYKIWRIAIFERDNYTCQVCQKRCSINLNAHHITRFSSILHEHKIDSMDSARDINILWDIKNGVTLCEECHKIAHEVSNNE